jgi:hypothetical protein
MTPRQVRALGTKDLVRKACRQTTEKRVGEEMQGITITDKCCGSLLLGVELIDILCLLGKHAKDIEWEISGVESIGGEAADKLHELSDKKDRLSGRALLQLAASVNQIIDGRFVGYRKGEDRPWIIIQAVDSSAYDVYCVDNETLTKIRQHFGSVEEISW